MVIEITKGGEWRPLPVPNDGYVMIGESGRGRKFVRVPWPLPGKEGAVWLILRDQSGFRGGWSLRGAGSYAERRGFIDAHPEGDYSEWGTPPEGYPPIRPHGLAIIAEGRCAQGDAGRMGGGPEFLALVRWGQEFEIWRTGRVYGRPTCLIVRVSETGVSVSDALAEYDSAKAKAAADAARGDVS